MEATGISHIAVCVRDLDKSLAFYRDILGMKITKDEIEDTSTGGLTHTYNITSGIWVTFQEILDRVIDLSPATQAVTPAGPQAEQAGEGYGRGPLSGHRLFDDLGWTPKYGLKTGLSDYLKWRKEANYLD